VMKSLSYSYRDRRVRKRDFRRLWIIRINAGARQNGMSYNQMMHGLKLAEVELDRKVLADIAVSDPKAFTVLADTAKAALAAAGWCARPGVPVALGRLLGSAFRKGRSGLDGGGVPRPDRARRPARGRAGARGAGGRRRAAAVADRPASRHRVRGGRGAPRPAR